MIMLYGAGGHAKVIIEILERQSMIIGGLIDKDQTIKSLLNYPVFKPDNKLFDSESEFIISIGNNKIRKQIAEAVDRPFITVLHPAANISKRCIMGDGSVVMAGVTINSDCVIGKHVIVNTNSSVDHDCKLHDYVHLSPNVALAGNVEVGEGSFLGINTCVIQGIKIGKWVTAGAGTVIIKDIPDHAVVVGNPGKIIKYNDQRS